MFPKVLVNSTADPAQLGGEKIIRRRISQQRAALVARTVLNCQSRTDCDRALMATEEAENLGVV